MVLEELAHEQGVPGIVLDEQELQATAVPGRLGRERSRHCRRRRDDGPAPS
jgi:hypothetical protein